MWTKEKMAQVLFDADFVSEVIYLALKIAQLQRNEDHLQNPDTLYSKFVAERKELAEAENLWDEIPDIVYYATCLIAWGNNYPLNMVEGEILPKYGVSVKQAKAACLAKYQRRAAGLPKDIEAERVAIIAVIRGHEVPQSSPKKKFLNIKIEAPDNWCMCSYPEDDGKGHCVNCGGKR